MNLSLNVWTGRHRNTVQYCISVSGRFQTIKSNLLTNYTTRMKLTKTSHYPFRIFFSSQCARQLTHIFHNQSNICNWTREWSPGDHRSCNWFHERKCTRIQSPAELTRKQDQVLNKKKYFAELRLLENGI